MTGKNQPSTGCNSASQTTAVHSQSHRSQPIDQDKFEFLKGLTSSSKHQNKTFFAHLNATYTHLKNQNLPEEVCDAGLFHSIYGTEFYEFSSDRITRDVVRGYIGEYAEELVYIFCGAKTKRCRAIVENTLGLSERQHIDLCYVEFANIWDQKERPGREAEAAKKLEILSQTIARLTNGQ